MSQSPNTISPASSMHSLRDVRQKSSFRSVESATSEQISVLRNQSNNQRNQSINRLALKKRAIKSKEKEETRYKLVRMQTGANREKMIIVSDDGEEEDEQEEEEDENNEENQEDEQNDYNRYKQGKFSQNQQVDKKNKAQQVKKMNEILTTRFEGKVKCNNVNSRSKSIKATTVEKTRWKCVQCKFMNRFLVDVCEICFRKNPWHKSSSGQRSVQIDDRTRLSRSSNVEEEEDEEEAVEETEEYESEYQDREKKSFFRDKKRPNRYSDDENDYAKFSDTSEERTPKTFSVRIQSINRNSKFKNEMAAPRTGDVSYQTISQSKSINEINRQAPTDELDESDFSQSINSENGQVKTISMKLNKEELDFLSGQSINSNAHGVKESAEEAKEDGPFESNETVVEMLNGRGKEDEEEEVAGQQEDDDNEEEDCESKIDELDLRNEQKREEERQPAAVSSSMKFYQNELYQADNAVLNAPMDQKKTTTTMKTNDSKMPKLFVHMRRAEQSGYDLEQLKMALKFAPDRPVGK